MGAAFERIEQAKLLLGEGVEEVRFFKALLTHLSLTGIQVAQTGGKGHRMHEFLRALPSFPGFSSLTALGVTRDADDDPGKAFQSVRNSLIDSGMDAPEEPLIASSGKPRVSVFIFPDCASSGMLESLCLEAVSENPAVKCVDAYFDCVKRETGQVPTNMWKARTHAWLASRAKPDKRLGEAAEAGDWPFDNAAFNQLSRFLRSL